MANKETRKFLTIEEKRQAVRDCAKENPHVVAAVYGVGYSTLLGWLKISRDSGIEAVGIKGRRRKYKRRPKAPTLQSPTHVYTRPLVEKRKPLEQLLHDAYIEIINLKMQLARLAK